MPLFVVAQSVTERIRFVLERRFTVGGILTCTASGFGSNPQTQLQLAAIEEGFTGTMNVLDAHFAGQLFPAQLVRCSATLPPGPLDCTCSSCSRSPLAYPSILQISMTSGFLVKLSIGTICTQRAELGSVLPCSRQTVVTLIFRPSRADLKHATHAHAAHATHAAAHAAHPAHAAHADRPYLAMPPMPPPPMPPMPPPTPPMPPPPMPMPPMPPPIIWRARARPQRPPAISHAVVHHLCSQSERWLAWRSLGMNFTSISPDSIAANSSTVLRPPQLCLCRPSRVGCRRGAGHQSTRHDEGRDPRGAKYIF